MLAQRDQLPIILTLLKVLRAIAMRISYIYGTSLFPVSDWECIFEGSAFYYVMEAEPRVLTLWYFWAKSSYSFCGGFEVEAEPPVRHSQAEPGNEKWWVYFRHAVLVTHPARKNVPVA